MRTCRHRVRKGGFGLFLGLAAEAARLPVAPSLGVPVSDRVWLDASEVHHAYYGNRLALNERELGRMRLGLGHVAGGVERVETSPYVLISVRTLQIIEVDYAEAALAPAIAGWVTEEFALPPRRYDVSREDAIGPGQFVRHAKSFLT